MQKASNGAGNFCRAKQSLMKEDFPIAIAVPLLWTIIRQPDQNLDL